MVIEMDSIFLWGTGEIAHRVIGELHDYIFDKYDIKGFIDNSVDRQGQLFYGRYVYSPEILEKQEFDYVVILTDSFDVISRQIQIGFEFVKNRIRNKNFFYEKLLSARYRYSDDDEIKKTLLHIEKNGLDIFNYDFVNEYDSIDIDVRYDTTCHMYYVLHENKAVYFKREINTKELAKMYYRSILVEQDIRSPHRYIDDGFQVKNDDVVVDAGVAEGTFSVEVVERVSKLYLIECDPKWMEALMQTFRDYRDKVVFINKYLTSYSDGIYSSLDNLINEPVNFIKMDIEGNEWEALRGAGEIIRRSSDLRCAICAYHADGDEELIQSELKRYGLKCSTTKGYMWFPYRCKSRYVSTMLHRGIIRGEK